MSDDDPDDLVFEAPEPAPAQDLADPALAGAWKPVGFWVDGRPMAELILNGSTMRVEFMDRAQRGRRSLELVVRGVDATPAGKDQLRGLTAELLGGWDVPSADVGMMIEYGYRREGELLRLAWSREDPTERPTELEADDVIALTFRRYEDAPEAEAPRDADGVEVDRSLEGRWLYVPENLRMVMLRDRVLVLTVPDNAVVVEREIILWEPESEPAKMESIVIGSPQPAELGDRHRTIYREVAPGRVRMAQFHEASPLKGRWPPSFELAMPMGLMAFEWERVDP
ncbi:MAG: hypothetical protein AAGA57_09885 [Planctomycetota bacterium]